MCVCVCVSNCALSLDLDLPLSDSLLRLLHQSMGHMKTDSCRAARKKRELLSVCVCVFACVEKKGDALRDTVADMMQTLEGSSPPLTDDFMQQICFLVVTDSDG